MNARNAANAANAADIVFINIHDPAAESRITQELAAQGIVFLEGLASAEDALGLVRRLGEVFRHRDAGPDGITRIHYRAEVDGQPSYDGFGCNALFPHTDVSSLDEPPGFLLQVCVTSSQQGGKAVLCDGRRVASRLQRDHPRLFSRAQANNAAMFPSATGVPTPRPIFERTPLGQYTIRFRLDDLIYFSARLSIELDTLLREIHAASFTVELQSGHGYLLNNRWWLHGREGFAGKREMWRILFNPRPAGASAEPPPESGTGARAQLPLGFTLLDAEQPDQVA